MHKKITDTELELLNKDTIEFILKSPITLWEVEEFLENMRYPFDVVHAWKSIDTLPYYDRFLIKVYDQTTTTIFFILRTRDDRISLIAPPNQVIQEFVAYFKDRIL